MFLKNKNKIKITLVTAVTVVTVVKIKLRNLSKKSSFFLSTFGKSNLTHLTTNVMFSGQRFAILAMWRGCVMLLPTVTSGTTVKSVTIVT